LQSELASLEDELARLDDRESEIAAGDAIEKMDVLARSTDWDSLQRQSEDKVELAVQRMDLIKRLRELMAEYRRILEGRNVSGGLPFPMLSTTEDALARDHEVALLSSPSKKYFKNYNAFLKSRLQKFGHPAQRWPLQNLPREDFVVTYREPKPDRLARPIGGLVMRPSFLFLRVSLCSMSHPLHAIHR
jgi:hypothetical protein